MKNKPSERGFFEWVCVIVLQEDGITFSYNEDQQVVPDNYMDRWILSFTQSLIKFVKEEMTGV